MWPILIKADDLSLNANLKKWRSFLQIVTSNRGVSDVGFISCESRTINGAKIFTKWLESIDRKTVTFFDHGTTHDKSEFLFRNSEEYLAAYNFEEEFQLKIFDKTPGGFGAPFNSLSTDAVDTYFRRFPGNYVYYPDINGGKPPLGFRYISHRYHVSFELKEENYNPSFSYFKKTYAQKVKNRQPLVLQVHPNRWSDKGFFEFSEILTYLRRLGGSFVFPDIFISSTNSDAGIRENVASSAVISNAPWFSNRYSAEALGKTLGVMNIILEEIQTDIHRLNTVVDIGAGVGEWLYLISEHIAAKSFVAIEPSKELAIALMEKYRAANKDIVVENVNFENSNVKNVDFSVCNRVLNYLDPIKFLKKISEISSAESWHYIGYQNVGFYLRGLLVAINTGDFARARRRANVLLGSLQYYVGREKRITDEVCIPLDDLKSVFKQCGFEFRKVTHQEGFYGDKGTVTGLLFKRQSSNKKMENLGVLAHLGMGRALGQHKNWSNEAMGEDALGIASLVLALESSRYREAVDSILQSHSHEKSPKVLIALVLATFGCKEYRKCADLISKRFINDF